MKYSKNKDFNNYIASLIATGDWFFKPKGNRKHGSLEHVNGKKCPIPGSPGDRRSLLNFKTMTRQMAM